MQVNLNRPLAPIVKSNLMEKEAMFVIFVAKFSTILVLFFTTRKQNIMTVDDLFVANVVKHSNISNFSKDISWSTQRIGKVQ